MNPLRDKIPFKNSYTTIERDGSTCYVHKYNSIFTMEIPKHTNVILEYVGINYTMLVDDNIITIILRTGFTWDGVTGAVDTEDRMLFSALHDVACLSSQYTGNPIFEQTIEKVTHKMLTVQGCNWFRAWRTHRAIRAYDSFKNPPTDLNVPQSNQK